MPPPGPDDASPRAVRLTFSFGPGGIQLVDRTPVAKRLPPADALPAALDATTIAAEVRGASDEPVFRRVMPRAIPQDVEVFDPDIPGGVRRDPSPPGSGVFTVLVPDDPAAGDVVLLGRPERDVPGAGGETAPAVEIARFPLRG